ncbi:hypothetical protein HELRODRAFT_116907 [Helobdella robusta]|uniref:C3H1-type domain-containing protein n=1 Tax=Helobdella robusta TaxID=6412 RepID=T1EGI5_HELRO|nr:hypothetical protein HELRODRAFT_116907 [Helobdella robusta]ESO11160.1 hypothetical protein HELRODRAFT_116907 [Helobdella robusta]
MEMGFKKHQAACAIQQCETVQAALDWLLSNQASDASLRDSISSNDDDDDVIDLAALQQKQQHHQQQSQQQQLQQQQHFVKSSSNKADSNNNTTASTTAATSTTTTNTTSTASSKQQKQQQKQLQKQQQQQQPLPPIPQHHYEQAQKQILMNKQQDVVKMNPRNPEGLTSLWVGNVLPEAKQENLIKLFSKYGQLQSVKCIPEKFCAFINFVNKECAGKAMECLQGADLLGQKLLIKFPDHPVNGEKIIKRYQQQQQQRTSGPVNGDECYFWRTTGCQFTGTCRYKHVPDHKGIDKKPWHKSK